MSARHTMHTRPPRPHTRPGMFGAPNPHKGQGQACCMQAINCPPTTLTTQWAADQKGQGSNTTLSCLQHPGRVSCRDKRELAQPRCLLGSCRGTAHFRLLRQLKELQHTPPAVYARAGCSHESSQPAMHQLRPPKPHAATNTHVGMMQAQLQSERQCTFSSHQSTPQEAERRPEPRQPVQCWA